MKKIFAICVLFALLLLSASCGDDNKKSEKKTDSEPADADSESVVTDEDKTDDIDSADSADDSKADDSDTNNNYPVIETFCEDDGTQGILTECADNAPCETTECPDGNSCNRTFTGCGECQNGTKSDCRESDSGMVIYQCYAGSLSVFKECPQGCNINMDDCAGDECTEGDTKCVNGNNEIGETYSCMNGRWQKDEGKCLGSCDETMKQCGESGCVNYTIECRDDMLDNGSGAIAQCRFGKWKIQSECEDGVSCKDENSCGECKNGSTKCEDRDVDGIMNKNCNAKGECETDSNGNTKWYPANIGVQLLCSNGEWSDDMYCPSVDGTFQKYSSGYVYWTTPMTWTYTIYKGVLVHGDYHYSSCHNTETVSECGTCNNHFNICSDENIGGKPQGHIYQCQNGQLVSNKICSNKTCNQSTLTSCN